MNRTDQKMITKMIEAKQDFNASVHKVLKGFYQRVGGEEKFGDKMGIMFDDVDNNAAAVRSNLGSAMLKLTMQMMEPDDGDSDETGLVTDEQLAAELKRLDALKEQ